MALKRRSLAAMFFTVIVPFSAFATRLQSNTADIRTLEAGKQIEREIAAGDLHTYQINLEAGQFLRAVVNQRGIDLVVTVVGPDGKKIADIDSPNGVNGPEPVNLSAKTTGAYRIEVRSLDKDAKPGRYDVKIEELLSAADYSVRLDTEKRTNDAVRNWLAQNAIKLSTVEAGHGFVDMQPLKKIVGDARVVSLGEATHGTREFFQLKHRMLEFLVSEAGFNIFAIEATMPESFDINEYVLTGKGDAAKALAGIYFWTWDTQEVLAMIEWMRSYNADPRHTRKVKFYGFDMQTAPRAAKVLLTYLRRVDPAQAELAAQELNRIANPYTATDFTNATKEKKTAAAEALKAAVASLESHKLDFIKRTSAEEWAIAHQHARVLAQNIEMLSASFTGIGQQTVRDRSMAENISWILDHEGPDSKMVVWAHNGHVATHNQYGMDWMGQHLRRALGRQMVVFGFAFNQGGFQAMEMPFPSETGLRSFTVNPASEGSLDAMLASAGLQIAAIDLHSLPNEGPVATWFSEPKKTRSIGAGYADQFAANFIDNQAAPKMYDALLFVEKTTAARPVDQNDNPGPWTKVATPTNTDFEEGETGQAPVGWRISPKLRRYDFQIATTEDLPYQGRRSIVISRMPGKHYGEIVGSFAQRLDAAPYRGKKIRLRAAARADVAGPGSLSWLRLNIVKKAFGPQATVFDSLDKYPVSSGEWRVFEIVADVPQDADSIYYGLALAGDGKAWLDAVSVEVVDH